MAIATVPNHNRGYRQNGSFHLFSFDLEGSQRSVRVSTHSKYEFAYCDPIFPNLSKQPIKVKTLGSPDGITFNDCFFTLDDFNEGVPLIIINVLPIGELNEDQPLWINLESGELLTGEFPAIVPCNRKNLDEHFKYYEQAVEGYDSINKQNHYTMPEY